jgi:putative hydroxymethylpyrimidine transport system permease protein
MTAALRPFVTAAVLLGFWEAAVRIGGIPAYLLPAPTRIAQAMVAQWPALLDNARFTATSMILGLIAGATIGAVTALALIASAGVRRWVLPLVILSQSLPVVVLAPLFVIWLGFGLESKVAMATLVTYFPVALAFYEGMKRTDSGLLDLGHLWGAATWQEIALLRAPSALPALASGLRGAAAAAPIGAIVGEWVGAAEGLGFLMTQSNARMQTDVMFAALVLLCLMAAALFFAVDRLLRRALHWAPETVADA